jgi:hypothetical protein
MPAQRITQHETNKKIQKVIRKPMTVIVVTRVDFDQVEIDSCIVDNAAMPIPELCTSMMTSVADINLSMLFKRGRDPKI